MLTFIAFVATIWVVLLPLRCLIAFCQGYLGERQRQNRLRYSPDPIASRKSCMKKPKVFPNLVVIDTAKVRFPREKK